MDDEQANEHAQVFDVYVGETPFPQWHDFDRKVTAEHVVDAVSTALGQMEPGEQTFVVIRGQR